MPPKDIHRAMHITECGMPYCVRRMKLFCGNNHVGPMDFSISQPINKHVHKMHPYNAVTLSRGVTSGKANASTQMHATAVVGEWGATLCKWPQSLLRAIPHTERWMAGKKLFRTIAHNDNCDNRTIINRCVSGYNFIDLFWRVQF